LSGADRPVAIVTGASRGIGKATAIELARAGFDVVATGRTVHDGTARLGPESDVVVPGGLDTTVEAVVAAGATGLAVPMDLLDPSGVEAVVPTVLDRFGRLDALVNNAVYQGPGTLAPISELSATELTTMFEGNVVAALSLVQAALRPMIAQGRGSVVNLISGAGLLTPPARVGEGGWSVGYAMTKAALGRLAPVLHVEYRDQGIRAFSVDPGLVMTERMEAAGRGDLYRRHFAAATPDVIGRAISWLLTDDAADELAGTVVMAQLEVRRRNLGGGPAPAAPPER